MQLFIGRSSHYYSDVDTMSPLFIACIGPGALRSKYSEMKIDGTTTFNGNKANDSGGKQYPDIFVYDPCACGFILRFIFLVYLLSNLRSISVPTLEELRK